MKRIRRNHIDLATLTAVLTLMVLSLGVVYSASATWAYEKFGQSSHMLNSHAIKILLGVVALFIGMNVDYLKFKKFTKPALIAAIVLLAVTFVLGGETKGATRWLRYGGIGLQPSEFAKFALLFHLCALISTKGEMIKDFKRGLMPMMIWIGAVVGLVMAQPNFSAGIMIVLLSCVMLFVSRAKLLHLFGTGMAVLPVVGLYMVSAPYRMERIRSFLGGRWGGKISYQLWQGIIGFGNGGIFGVGPGESKQRDFFLPESYGDFVFSIIGEEYGFIGTIFFLGLFLFIMLRGFKIAKNAKDEFSRLLPTTGLPMPFVSYGGSSLLFTSFAVGILLNISSRTDLHPRAQAIEETVVMPGTPETNAGKIY
jgi:cell division protein FtsW